MTAVPVIFVIMVLSLWDLGQGQGMLSDVHGVTRNWIYEQAAILLAENM